MDRWWRLPPRFERSGDRAAAGLMQVGKVDRELLAELRGRIIENGLQLVVLMAVPAVNRAQFGIREGKIAERRGLFRP